MKTFENFLNNWFTTEQSTACPSRNILDNDLFIMPLPLVYQPSITTTITTNNSCMPKKPVLVKLVNNNPHTIAFWSDNTQTMATCLPEDTYSPKRGLFICRMKKKYGSWTAYENHRADKVMMKYLRKIGRNMELKNALIINVK